MYLIAGRCRYSLIRRLNKTILVHDPTSSEAVMRRIGFVENKCLPHSHNYITIIIILYSSPTCRVHYDLFIYSRRFPITTFTCSITSTTSIPVLGFLLPKEVFLLLQISYKNIYIHAHTHII